MTSLLQRVKAKMAIFAHRKARGMLDGEYGSVFRGRSLDFDDLRAYIPGTMSATSTGRLPPASDRRSSNGMSPYGARPSC
ncbi:conserved hypothetical protein [Arthrobacter sp. Hiyo4]|nr:conserved hypothetical protein [Arthrobacter sp. Hiyo4]